MRWRITLEPGGSNSKTISSHPRTNTYKLIAPAVKIDHFNEAPTSLNWPWKSQNSTWRYFRRTLNMLRLVFPTDILMQFIVKASLGSNQTEAKVTSIAVVTKLLQRKENHKIQMQSRQLTRLHIKIQLAIWRTGSVNVTVQLQMHLNRIIRTMIFCNRLLGI